MPTNQLTNPLLRPQPMQGPEFECWNVRCIRYAGNGQRLTPKQVYKVGNEIHCGYCQSLVKQAPSADANATALAGMAGGALLGAAIGGGAGALVGAFIGLIVATQSPKGSQ